MIHRKLPGLMSPIEKVARVAGSASDAARSLDTRPSGSVSYDNADGTRTVIGPAAGDMTIATHVGDTTAPPDSERRLGVVGRREPARVVGRHARRRVAR